MRPNILSLFAGLLLAPSLFSQVKTPAPLAELSSSFETLARRVRPSVVQIFATGYATGEDSNTSNTALLSKQRSTGSGVILSEDGMILTNNHVVRNALKIEVKLHPDRAAGGTTDTMFPGKLIGVDREADLAVIKVECKGLPRLMLADSDALHQGQLVMAFGNPLGLEGSMTMGIISSTARHVKLDDPMSYVQTDAPINPGNSGGPLVDVEGRVVGINTFIFSQGGGSEGIGFAVPSNLVRSSYEQILKDGHVHRGQIGIVAQTITPTIAKGLGLTHDSGVIVADVTPDGPADKAGVKSGDIVTTLDGKAMDNASELENLVYLQKLSAIVDLTVLRDGKTLNLSMPVIERDDDPQRFADMVNPEKNLIRRLGILAIQITDQLAQMLPDLRHDYGIVVAARATDSPGAVLEPGDVIYQINKIPATSIDALRAALNALKPGDPIVLHIQRGDKLRYIEIELD